ncbi:phospholipase effector Tle1 domain-containing protein [Neisseria elongata]|jgi:hypothetical protein|uniref:phospholipase effector Tle1 domain-containing protein n=1 Tax=Neisseria elongata TaxID=495 RepID=UPI001959F851|nr:DUF2235 domain-containing protein [Neisseria elongata]MBM7065236.1 DUF2235 domain-containing protein [Neisseria elongata]GMQ51870.1 hypothetical protein LST1_21610 [Neisseria elongata]
MPTGVVQQFSCQKEIRFGLFFDGTGNNRFTDEKKTKVYLKRLNADNYDPQQLQKTTSYLSNVAKLFLLFDENNENSLYKEYIPGVGTPFSANDEGKPNEGEGSIFGSALGYGGNARLCYAFWRLYSIILNKEGLGNGIIWEQSKRPEKIENDVDTFPEYLNKHLREAIEKSRREKRKTSKVSKIILYVFGFSRGAAEARSFVNRLSRLSGSSAAQLKFGGIDVEVKFMGIFDTVASVGMVDIKSFRGNGILPRWFGSLVDGHWSWASPENLVVPDNIRCVHYIAGNEARACFPLTMTEHQGNHTLKLYPGAHSDVGGGYGFMEQGKYDMSVIPGREMYDEAISAGTPFKNLMPYDINQMKLDDVHTLYGEILAHHDFFTAFNAIKDDMSKMLKGVDIAQEGGDVCTHANNIAQYNQSYLVYRGIMLRKISLSNKTPSKYQTQTKTWYGRPQNVPRFEWQDFYLRAKGDAERTQAQESTKKPTSEVPAMSLSKAEKKREKEVDPAKLEQHLERQPPNYNSVIGLKVVNDLLEEGLSIFNRRWLSTFGVKHSYHPTVKGILEKYRERPRIYLDEKNDEYEKDLYGEKAIKLFYNDYVHDSQASFYIGMGLLEYSGRVRIGRSYWPTFIFGNGQGLARYRGIYRIEGNTATWMKYEPEGDISQHIGLNGKAN